MAAVWFLPVLFLSVTETVVAVIDVAWANLPAHKHFYEPIKTWLMLIGARIILLNFVALGPTF